MKNIRPLRAEGLNAGICINLPACCDKEKLPILFSVEPAVKITTGSGGFLLLASDRQNAGNFDVCNAYKMNRKIKISKSSFSKEERAGLKELIDKWFASKYRQLVLKAD